MTKGKFIVFEGCDGVGKTTQSHLLKETLKKNGIDAIYTREPGGTFLGEKLRPLLLNNKLDKISELLLFNAIRRDHINDVIIPSLEKGTWVICDRFWYSTLAYQGYGHKIDIEHIIYLHKMICPILQPDILFTLTPGINRILENTELIESKSDNLEDHKKFFQTVEQAFLNIDPSWAHNLKNISSQESQTQIFNIIKNYISTTIGIDLSKADK